MLCYGRYMTIGKVSGSAEKRAQPSSLTKIALFVLALLTIGVPLATDLYLPTFLAMMTDLDATAGSVQLSLSAFLIGAAVGQLIFGPLSDRFGRRWPLLIGLLVFVLAGFASTLAMDVTSLIAFRVVQGLSGAAGVVISRAIISDRVTGLDAARAMNVLMAIAGVAPALAPVLGSLLAPYVGWRGLLAVVVIFALVTLMLAVFTLPESLPRSARGREQASAGWRVLCTRGFVGNTLASAAAYGSLLAYIAASPFIYQSMIGLTEVGYALVFGANAIGMLVVTLVSSRFAHRLSPARGLRLGVIAHLLAAAVFTAIAISDLSPILLVAPLFIAVASLGLVLGNSTALALESVSGSAGLASAVLGMLQFGVGAVGTALVGLGGEGSALPLGIIMIVASVVAMVMSAIARAGGGAR